jgi:hypothetical protein
MQQLVVKTHFCSIEYAHNSQSMLIYKENQGDPEGIVHLGGVYGHEFHRAQHQE